METFGQALRRGRETRAERQPASGSWQKQKRNKPRYGILTVNPHLVAAYMSLFRLPKLVKFTIEARLQPVTSQGL
jgi:hypothetical protein